MTTSWALRVLATVLAVAGVLPLGADADAARYIRIYHISDTPVNIINLMEIEPYDCFGNYVRPVAASMNGSLGGWPASNCIDLSLAGTGCHSTNTADSWLEIDMGRVMSLSQVIVRNRVDCCSFRIVGYSIALFTESGGNGMQSYPQLFASEQPMYTFTFNNGGCPTLKDIRTFSDLGMARYIQIFREATGIINLAEIQAYDCNGNIIQPESVAMSSSHPAFPSSNCIDNTTGFCHTANEPNASVAVDLGRYALVSYVVVTNRVDCCTDRIVNYSIGLFAGPGYAPVAPFMTFLTVAPVYTFNFSPCTSVRSLDTTVGLMGQNIGYARYVRIWNDGPSTLNLNEVQAFDCSGNLLAASFATLSTAHGAGPAINCINNDTSLASDFCHTAAPDHNWLEVDYGYAQQIGYVVVRARIDCCGARIEGFNIGLFNQEMGGLPVGAPAVFGTYQAPGIYNFTTLNTCVNVGAISTGVAAALTDLQNSTISTLTEQLIPLSSIMAAESTLMSTLNTGASGGLAGAITAASSIASDASTNIVAVSNTVATLSTSTSGQISNLNDLVGSTAQSLAGVSNSLSALQAAIQQAVNAGPTGSPVTSPFIGSMPSGTINVASGSCVNSDLCDATSFAANLKQALTGL